MNREIEEKLAESLTAQTTELLPFLPYLLQDFWELGIDPDLTIQLIRKHVRVSASTRILDLACGKGAVSVKLAQQLGVQVKGIDLIPEFIRHAHQKAREFNVAHLCEFTVGDINEAVEREKEYDCTVFGAVGNVLGDSAQTITKLMATVKQGGYILLDNYDCITQHEWTQLFQKTGVTLMATVVDEAQPGQEPADSFQLITNGDAGVAAITARAQELMEHHPQKKALFEGYVASQQQEYEAIASQSPLTNVSWLLQKP